ncbi:MAG: hypothetical protein K1X29_02760 [Bdellovibrionales bacterium]|nr:hypothetical protein [Bdellovibrionales bacterium]
MARSENTLPGQEILVLPDFDAFSNSTSFQQRQKMLFAILEETATQTVDFYRKEQSNNINIFKHCYPTDPIGILFSDLANLDQSPYCKIIKDLVKKFRELSTRDHNTFTAILVWHYVVEADRELKLGWELLINHLTEQLADQFPRPYEMKALEGLSFLVSAFSVKTLYELVVKQRNSRLKINGDFRNDLSTVRIEHEIEPKGKFSRKIRTKSTLIVLTATVAYLFYLFYPEDSKDQTTLDPNQKIPPADILGYVQSLLACSYSQAIAKLIDTCQKAPVTSENPDLVCLDSEDSSRRDEYVKYVTSIQNLNMSHHLDNTIDIQPIVNSFYIFKNSLPQEYATNLNEMISSIVNKESVPQCDRVSATDMVINAWNKALGYSN